MRLMRLAHQRAGTSHGSGGLVRYSIIHNPPCETGAAVSERGYDVAWASEVSIAMETSDVAVINSQRSCIIASPASSSSG
jgi:hypothetical protein